MASVSNDLSRFVIVNVDPESPVRGPFVIAQRGSDPNDPRLIERGWALARDGAWVEWAQVIGDSGDAIEELIYDTTREVVEALDNLSGKARIRRLNRDPHVVLNELDQVEARGGIAAAIRRALAERPPRKKPQVDY